MRPDNNIIVMWGSKGGAGTSVTAAAAAIHEPNHVLLVDLDGDAASILGLANARSGIGVGDWLKHPNVERARLTELVDDIDANTSVLKAGSTTIDIRYADPERVADLAAWINDQPGIVIVDAGTGPPPPQLVAIADRNVMVTRADYLALSNPAVLTAGPDEVILISEPGRSLQARDIERVVNAPVTATIDHDPVIARSVDAGLFIGHHALQHATDHLTDPDRDAPGRPEPEIDYGMRWTSATTDGTFRVSYDPGTHQLTATNNATHSTELLGRYDNIESVDRALEGWPQRHDDPNGLDWVQEQVGLEAPDFDGPPPPTTIPPPSRGLSIDL